MKTHWLGRLSLVGLVVVVCGLFSPSQALAQMPEIVISTYADMTAQNDEDIDLYHDAADWTDLSPWGGLIYHYNYNLTVTAAGSAGTFKDNIMGLIGLILRVVRPNDDNDYEYEVTPVVTFWCSAAGFLGGEGQRNSLFVPSFRYRYGFLAAYEESYKYEKASA